MNTETLYFEGLTEVTSKQDFTFFQRAAMRRFHPRSILMSVVGAIWFVYFLWNQQWVPAVIAVVAERLIANLAVRKVNYTQFASTIWGKLALLHLHPANMAIQTASLVILCIGLWNHDTLTNLVAVSILFLGHWFGWEKVQESFA